MGYEPKAHLQPKVKREYHLGPSASSQWKSYTRDEWLELVMVGTFVPQPPDWWFRTQAEKGRTTNAAAAIWHKNYPAARKFVVWDQAPEVDFFHRGYRWGL